VSAGKFSVKVKDGCAVFTLANGSQIRMHFEDRLGVDGFLVYVTADRGMLHVLPRSGNSIALTTDRAQIQLDAMVREVVAKRDLEMKGSA
jgi:hypothetical protein